MYFYAFSTNNVKSYRSPFALFLFPLYDIPNLYPYGKNESKFNILIKPMFETPVPKFVLKLTLKPLNTSGFMEALVLMVLKKFGHFFCLGKFTSSNK